MSVRKESVKHFATVPDHIEIGDHEPAFLRQCVEQYEQLIVKRKAARNYLENTGKEPDPSIWDLRRSIQILGEAIALFAKTNLAVVLETFPIMVEKFPYAPAEKKSSKKPTKTDAPVTVEDVTDDDSVEFCVLRVLKQVFVIAHEEGTLGDVPMETVEFVMDKLEFTYSAAIRNQAKGCLHALSHGHLGSILELLRERMGTIRKDKDERLFVPFQHAVGGLAFGVEDEERAALTFSYLEDMAEFIARLKRGVLRQEVANTVREVLLRVMKNNTESAVEWARLAAGGDAIDLGGLWGALESIFAAVVKWGKKVKHAPFCFPLAATMLCCISGPFFRKNSRDFHKLILASVKDKALRAKAFEAMADYLGALPDAYVQDNLQYFESTMNDFVVQLFNKKTFGSGSGGVDPSHVKGVLMELGRKHIHMALNTVVTLIQSSSYTADQKAVALSFVSDIAAEHKAEVSAQSFEIVPILNPLLSSWQQAKSLTLVRAAVSCFPKVLDIDPQVARHTAIKIADLTMHPDRELGTVSTLSIHDHILADPGLFVVPVTQVLARFLTDVTALDTVNLVKAFQNMHMVVAAFAEYCAGGRVPVVDYIEPGDWIDARKTVEGVCLLWLIHPDFWIRSEAMRVLTHFSGPAFRDLERALLPGRDLPPWLGDAITLPPGDDTLEDMERDLLAEVIALARTRFSDFKVALVWAWEQTAVHDWNMFRDDNDGVASLSGDATRRAREAIIGGRNVRESEIEQIVWENRLIFMCGVLKFSHDTYRAAELDRTRQIVADTREEEDLPGAEELRVEFDAPLVHAFVNELIEMVHSRDYNLADRVLTAIGEMDVCCFEEVTDRLLSYERAHRKKQKDADEVLLMATSERICGVFAKMMSVFESLEQFEAVTKLATVVPVFVGKWLHSKNRTTLFGGDTSLRMRQAVAQVLSKYLALIDLPVGHDGATIRKFLPVHEFLMHLLPSTALAGAAESRSLIIGVEKAVFSCYVVLLSRGPVSDGMAVENDIIVFLANSHLRGAHLFPLARQALVNMLYHKPSLISLFMKSAFSAMYNEISMPDGAVERIRMHDVNVTFLHAIVKNFYELERWTEAGMHPARLVQMCLHFLCHANSEIRSLAVELANILATHPATLYNPFPHLPQWSHPTELMYMQAVINYSRALADNNVNLTVPLIRVVKFFSPMCDIEEKIASLQFLIPWTINVAPLLLSDQVWFRAWDASKERNYYYRGDEVVWTPPKNAIIRVEGVTAEEDVALLISVMFILTRECLIDAEAERSYSYLQHFWASTLKRVEPARQSFVVDFIVDFLVSQNAEALQVAATAESAIQGVLSTYGEDAETGASAVRGNDAGNGGGGGGSGSASNGSASGGGGGVGTSAAGRLASSASDASAPRRRRSRSNASDGGGAGVSDDSDASGGQTLRPSRSAANLHTYGTRTRPEKLAPTHERDPYVAATIAVFLGRTHAANLVVDALVRKLRNYDFQVSLDADGLIALADEEVDAAAGRDPYQEAAAFAMLTELMFENDSVFLDYLPPLLQNCFGLVAHRNDRLFKDFLRNVLHSLAIRWAPTADERTAAVDFFEAYFADGDPLATDFAAPTADVYATSAPASLRGVPATMVSSGSAGSGLSPAAATGPGSEGPLPGAEGAVMARVREPAVIQLVDHLSARRPSLRSEWANLCLVWAVQNGDPKLALRSLQLFAVLNVSTAYNVVYPLGLAAFMAIRDSDTPKLKLILQILYEMVCQPSGLPTNTYHLIVDVAAICLSTVTVSVFKLCLQILTEAFDRNGHESTSSSIEQIRRVVSVWQTVDEATPDGILANLLAIGLIDEDTFGLTLPFLDRVAVAYADELPCDNHLTIMCMLSHCLNVLKATDKKTAGALAVTFVTETAYLELQGFVEVFQDVVLDAIVHAAAEDVGPGGGTLGPHAAPRELDTEHAFDPEPFLDRFFAVYSGVFSSFPSFDFAVEALMEMVRGGLLSARHHIYRIITVLSRNATFFWSAEQFTTLANHAIESFFNLDSDLTAAVTDLLKHMADNCPGDVARDVFDFNRKPQELLTSPKYMRRVQDDVFFGKDKEANYYVNLALHHLSSLFRISDAKYAERDAGTTLPLRVRSSSSQAHMRRLSQAARATTGKAKKKAKGKASRVAPRRSTHDAPLTRGDIASQTISEMIDTPSEAEDSSAPPSRLGTIRGAMINDLLGSDTSSGSAELPEDDPTPAASGSDTPKRPSPAPRKPTPPAAKTSPVPPPPDGPPPPLAEGEVVLPPPRKGETGSREGSFWDDTAPPVPPTARLEVPGASPVVGLRPTPKPRPMSARTTPIKIEGGFSTSPNKGAGSGRRSPPPKPTAPVLGSPADGGAGTRPGYKTLPRRSTSPTPPPRPSLFEMAAGDGESSSDLSSTASA